MPTRRGDETGNRSFDRFFSRVVLLLVGYGLSLLTAVGGMTGQQYLDENLWVLESLPYVALLSGCGFVCTIAVTRQKRWEVYGLIVTWILTSILNLVFVPPLQPVLPILVAFSLILAFFMFLKPAWPQMT